MTTILQTEEGTVPAPPVAVQRSVALALHGDERVDDYAWMRNRDDPAVTEYLEAENAYTEAMTAPAAALAEALYREMLARIKETDEQVPVFENGWYYSSKTEEGKAYPIFVRKRALDAPDEIIFDQNEEAKPYEFHQLGGFEVSPDGNSLAVLVDTNGYEDFVLQIRDLRTGAWIPDRVEKLSWGLAWASDNATIFYVSGDAAKRPDKVWRHRLGAPIGDAAAIYHEESPLFNVSIHRARSGGFVFIHASSFTQDEWYALDAADGAARPRLIAERASGLEYDVDHGGSWFYIRTNSDGATNFKVMRAPVNAPGAWEEFIPYEAGVFVEDIDVFRDWLVKTERRDGLRRLAVRALATGEEHDIAFPDAAYDVELGRNPEFSTMTLRFTYSSFVTPPSVYDYNLASLERTLRKRQEVLGGYNPTLYDVERRMVTARDGVRIPVSLVYRRGIALDGTNPLLLYAYGSYGTIIEPSFSSNRFSLVDRGFVFAIAHIRGGQEMGRTWYDDGKMLRKMNTFNDFLDVAEDLIKAGYTSRDKLVAHGGSAGGLLMGAVANMRPGTFRAIVADVPFVDVINTMLDVSIPLTAQEWEQWGNPRIAEHYEYMKQYSPYDNVRAQDYPRMLVMSGINDSRVAFWEPAKWVAKLRATKTDGNVLLLRMLMGAGHGGASGRYERLREAAFRYAFILGSVD